MSRPIISVRELSKRYRLGEDKAAFPNPLAAAVNAFKRQFRADKVVEEQEHREYIWALDKVSFNIEEGDRVGVIGKNGAGKSTLLKILSRVVAPSSGEAVLRGRMTSLLEVGTGFNDALSGRENIYLNAALHGLKKSEISERFADIVAFSEIGDFIDTPVKNYSTGMRARLAFAVAAHLDPDILMLDEVLAVGDMSFQKKCLARMEGLMGGGRALLFVSHSIDAICRYCDKALWLDRGRLVMYGPAEEVTATYAENSLQLRPSLEPHAGHRKPPRDTGQSVSASGTLPSSLRNEPAAHLLVARVTGLDGRISSLFTLDQDIAIEFDYQVEFKGLFVPGILISSSEGLRIFASVPTETNFEHYRREPGRYRARVVIPAHFLNVGSYHVTVVVNSPDVAPLKRHFQVERAISFHCVEARDNTLGARGVMPREFPGLIRPRLEWSQTEIVELETGAVQRENFSVGTDVK